MATRNRHAVTKRCLDTLAAASHRSGVFLRFVVFDDGSDDGTLELLQRRLSTEDTVVVGDGTFFWARAMRNAMMVALDDYSSATYVLLVNDDVSFNEDALASLLVISRAHPGSVVVGSTRDQETGEPTYGGLRRRSSVKRLSFDRAPQISGDLVDTMNCNAVLVPMETFRSLGPFDWQYVHALADYAYGLKARRLGFDVRLGYDFVGSCAIGARNSWDSLAKSRRERWRAMQQPKGLPWTPWKHYCRTNGGPLAPLYFVKPLLRLLPRQVSP